MKHLSEYIHTKGLLFGLYSSAGVKTCEGRAGGLDYEEADAQDYAYWEVDYLKYDNCNNLGRPATERYKAMRDALNKTGRPIFYSICNWGEEDSPEWGQRVGNSWRTTLDINDSWKLMIRNFFANDLDQSYSGPGGWNDPDMLEVGVHDKDGNYGMTIEEEKTHFALWSIMKAPLIIGADLKSIRKESLDILMNKELIAVNQDPNSEQAKCFGYEGCKGQIRTYVTTLSTGAKVVTVTNFLSWPMPTWFFVLKDLGLSLEKHEEAIVTDLYDDDYESKVGWTFQPIWTGWLSSHETRVFKIQVTKIADEEDDEENFLDEEDMVTDEQAVLI